MASACPTISIMTGRSTMARDGARGGGLVWNFLSGVGRATIAVPSIR
jgi:hypothetical protein